MEIIDLGWPWRLLCAIIAKRCEIRPRLITNTKLHVGFQITWKSFNWNDPKGQYCNRNCIGCSVSSRARRFYSEKYLQNLHPIFSLFIYSVAIYIAWQHDHMRYLGTNLIHDFTAVTFSVKSAIFTEKRRFSWNPWFFVNFSAFSLIYDNSRVLSAAFVRMLLFATCRTSALSSWHWLSWVLT